MDQGESVFKAIGAKAPAHHPNSRTAVAAEEIAIQHHLRPESYRHPQTFLLPYQPLRPSILQHFQSPASISTPRYGKTSKLPCMAIPTRSRKFHRKARARVKG